MSAKSTHRLAVCSSFLVSLALTLGSTANHAQSLLENPDWKESEAPPAPAFNPDGVLPLDMPPYVTLKFGIDPATLRITPDGIVRYVVVVRNDSGSVTAFYEGIFCAKGEVKQYARTQSDGQWRAVAKPQWRSLDDNQPSKHAWAFARQGACDNSAAASSVGDIVRVLKK